MSSTLIVVGVLVGVILIAVAWSAVRLRRRSRSGDTRSGGRAWEAGGYGSGGGGAGCGGGFSCGGGSACGGGGCGGGGGGD